MLKKIVYKIGSKFYNTFSVGSVASRPMQGLNKKLYFEKDQYIGFAMRSVITHEERVKNRIKKYIKPGDTVFDVGSNIGQFAMFFSELVGEKGKVSCYEPHYNNFTFLTFNKLKNRCDNVIITNKGVGAEVQKKEFFKDKMTGGRTSSFVKEYIKGNQKNDSEVMSITTLDEEIKQHGIPNFIKIDVEGFEHEVLKGLTKLPDNTKFMIEVRSETRKPIFDYFHTKGFKCFYLDVEEIEEITRSEDIFQFANLLFMK